VFIASVSVGGSSSHVYLRRTKDREAEDSETMDSEEKADLI